MYLASRFALSLAAMQQADVQSYNVKAKIQKTKARMMPHSAAHYGGVGMTDTFVAPHVARRGHGPGPYLWHADGGYASLESVSVN